MKSSDYEDLVFEIRTMNFSSRKIWVKRLVITISILLLGYFIFRNSLLNYFLDKTNQRLKERFGLILSVHNHGFSGFSTICFSGLYVAPQMGDTLLHLDTISFRPDFKSLLTGKVGISQLFLQNGSLKLNSSRNGNNIEFLHHDTFIKRDTVKMIKMGYASFVKNAVDKIFALAPQQAEITNLALTLQSDSFNTGVVLKNYQAKKDFVRGEVDEVATANKWFFEGD